MVFVSLDESWQEGFEAMESVGRVESLWRYPVKSMRGEPLEEAYAGFAGFYGDRLYAFRSSAAPAGFPYLTGREQGEMLRYRPRFRDGEAMSRPVNLEEAMTISPNLLPVYAHGAATAVEVETPDGERLAIDDEKLRERLRSGLRERHELSLLRCDRPMADCKPVSLFSLQTARQLTEEVGVPMDPRRFRANVYLDLAAGLAGFGEDELVGRQVRIGERVVVAVLDRDARCKMITLDPDTGEANPEVMRVLSQLHEGKAGVYGAVLVEGTVRVGDEVVLV